METAAEAPHDYKEFTSKSLFLGQNIGRIVNWNSLILVEALENVSNMYNFSENAD